MGLGRNEWQEKGCGRRSEQGQGSKPFLGLDPCSPFSDPPKALYYSAAQPCAALSSPPPFVPAHQMWSNRLFWKDHATHTHRATAMKSRHTIMYMTTCNFGNEWEFEKVCMLASRLHDALCILLSLHVQSHVHA